VSKSKKTKQILLDKCPECGSIHLIHDYNTGETLCGECGLVLTGLMMNEGPEWRAFTPQEKISKNRVGLQTAYSIHDKGLSTDLQVERDAYGRKLSASTSLQIWRLRKLQIHSRLYSSIDRSLAQAMTELERVSGILSIPKSIKEKTAIIYRKALNINLVKGRSIAGIIAASIYAACRESKNPRTIREISEASLISKKDVARYYRILLRELDINVPVADPLTYISKIAVNTKISEESQGLAIQILREARKKRGIAGKDPKGLAAAALYVACLKNNEKHTQKSIAGAAGITEVTLRNRYKAL
jgi:transcription initiation factor TFIIB